MDQPSAQLLAEWARGSQSAADELFRRYIGRLTAMARGRISKRLGRRLDPEDVALSACRSFFVRARDGNVRLDESADLWRLLAAITLNKLHRNVAHHRAARRSIDREQPAHSAVAETLAARLANHMPATAVEAACLAEQWEQFLAELTNQERQILELRMQDLSQTEIAALTGKSERTVRRILTRLQERLERRLLDPPSDENPPPDQAIAPEPAAESPPAPPKVRRSSADVPAHSGESSLAGPWLADSDFHLTRHLGTGGSGKVYLAWWHSRRQWVALKVLKKRIQSDPEAVERFIREAATVNRLAHPGIVPILDIGRLRSEGHFLVLELMANDLQAVSRRRRIEVVQALNWIARTAFILDDVHAQGVIHCDLKPANLLLDAAEQIRITDFGLARVQSDPRQRFAPAGTLGYMAPEQFDPAFGSIGPRTDIFGLGAVLFALLTERVPHLASTWEQTLDQLTHAEPPSVRGIRPDVSEAVEAIVQRCLARDPRDRFESAAELASAILQTLQQLGSLA